MPVMQAMPSRTNALFFEGQVGAAGAPALIQFDITALLRDIRKTQGFWDRVDILGQALDAGITGIQNPQLITDLTGEPIAFTVEVFAGSPTDEIQMVLTHAHTSVA